MDEQLLTKKSTLESELDHSESYQRHKKQRFWQILAPVGLGVLLMLAIAAMVVLTATGTIAGGSVSQWADTSFIWLIIPVMLFAIVFTLIIIGLIYLLAQVLNILPQYTFLVQQYVNLFEIQVKYWTRKIVSPVISIGSFTAAVEAFFSALSGRVEK